MHDLAKPVAIKGSSRKCGGCVEKVARLIPGDLRGCPRCLVRVVRGVGWTVAAERSRLAVEKSAEAVVPAGLMVAGKG